MRCRSMVALALVGSLVPPTAAMAGIGQAPGGGSGVASGGIETFRSGSNVVQIDRTGKGAVLCALGIYEAVSAVGRVCHPGQDVAFQAELDRSIARTDKFVIANSKRPVTMAELQARRAEALRQMRSSGRLCTGDAQRMYELFRSRGAAALHAQTTDLLSLPREPVMNPCL